MPTIAKIKGKLFNITLSVCQFKENSYPPVALEIDLPVFFFFCNLQQFKFSFLCRSICVACLTWRFTHPPALFPSWRAQEVQGPGGSALPPHLSSVLRVSDPASTTLPPQPGPGQQRKRAGVGRDAGEREGQLSWKAWTVNLLKVKCDL